MKNLARNFLTHYYRAIYLSQFKSGGIPCVP